jgi:hypothetical protein
MTPEQGRYQAAGYEHLRASTADRERATEILKTAFTEGRLAQDEFVERTGLAYSSRTYADLDRLTADLPAPRAAPHPGPAYPVRPVPPPVPRRNTLAIVAFVCCFIPGLPALCAIILGIIARQQIKRSGERGKVLATLAILISLSWLLFIVAEIAAGIVGASS